MTGEARPRVIRLALLVLQVAVLTAMALLLVGGDGPGSGRVLAELTDQHGVNSGDIPVVALWLVGVGAAVLAYRPA